MKKGDRVKVDFISESRTIYSGKRFTGYGVLDRVEDGRVFGRLDDGTPFMCLCADVEVVGMSDFEKWFRSLNANGKTVYFLGNEHKVSEMAWNHQQAIIDQLKAQLNNMEACYIEKKKELEELHSATDKALTHVKRQTECFRDLKTDATDMQTKNWWQAKVQILNPIRRMLEAALRGAND